LVLLVLEVLVDQAHLLDQPVQPHQDFLVSHLVLDYQKDQELQLVLEDPVFQEYR
jgi:hypothetical protein